jgi:hypothetical protein
VDVAKAVISQDNEYLHNTAASALDHIMLLLLEAAEEGAGELPTDDLLLLSQHCTPSASIETLRKMQRLVS